MTRTPNLLTLPDVAARIGVGVDSIRVYHQRATKNRRLGLSRPGDLPPPDETYGRSPVWRESTIASGRQSAPDAAPVAGASRATNDRRTRRRP